MSAASGSTWTRECSIVAARFAALCSGATLLQGPPEQRSIPFDGAWFIWPVEHRSKGAER